MTINVYQYLTSEVYDGLPNSTEELKSNSESLPIEAKILLQIRNLNVLAVIYGKKIEGKKDNHRRYGFKIDDSSVSEGWGLCYLYLVGEENFLANKPAYRYLGKVMQAIPMTYEQLSQLPPEELLRIYGDLT